jgi:hypothetical protein
MIFTYVLKIYLSFILSFVHPPLPFPTFLDQFQQVSFFIFACECKIHPLCSPFLKIFLLFIYSHVHLLFGSFLPHAPRLNPFPLSPLVSRQNPFWAFLQFSWRVEIRNNKKDIAFLLVEIKTAIQRDC